MSKSDFDYVYRPKRYLDVIEPKWLERHICNKFLFSIINSTVSGNYIKRLPDRAPKKSLDISFMILKR